MLRQFIVFVAAGAVATAIHYAVLMVLVNGGAAPVPASTAGATLGALLNYALNRRFTFHSGRAHRAALPRYLLVAALGLAFNAALLSLFLLYVSHYLLAQLAATGLILLWNFAANRRWTFREARHAH